MGLCPEAATFHGDTPVFSVLSIVYLVSYRIFSFIGGRLLTLGVSGLVYVAIATVVALLSTLLWLKLDNVEVPEGFFLA